jgi:adenine-specific DNA-methyltransferase
MPDRRSQRPSPRRPAKPGETVAPPPTATSQLTAQILALVPEADSEGRIDWERLRSVLSDELAEEPDRYGFSWAGRRDAARLLQIPSRATLAPEESESLDIATTVHAFIEGDNLEVLKLLYKSYFGRVKMIYIDPPYNTGTDLVYMDDFTDPLEQYLVTTGQADSTGDLLTSKPEKAGRFHSAWLSMMYPRLFYARQLLRDDGVIFISIDDRELHNLRMLLNAVFGEENFVGTFVWNSKKGGGSDSATAVTDHEYVLCYSRLPNQPILSRIELDTEALDKKDEKGPYRQGRELNKWGANSRREDRPTMFFPITGPDGDQVYPIKGDGEEGCWRWGKKKMYAIVEAGDAEFVQLDDGRYRVYEKIRSTDAREKPYRTWMIDVGQTADGSKALKELFDGKKPYDFPKPVALVKHLVAMGTTSADDIVLDFFAGSCTTAQAVWELNLEDGGSRAVICAQLPEATPKGSEARKMGYMTLTDVGKERMRRAGRALVERDTEPVNGPLDVGFKVFKLTPSNWRLWEGLETDRPDDYVATMALFTDPLADGWLLRDVIQEVALKEGYQLNSRVERLADVEKNEVWRVTDDGRRQSFFICLDQRLDSATPKHLKLSTEALFICRDIALSDTQAANLALQCRLKVI